MKVQNASIDDLEEIVRIYNWAIKNTTATFDTQEKTTVSQIDWFNQYDERFPIIVIKNNSEILAWGSLSQWSDRCAYSNTAEVSVYACPDHHEKGIGSKMLENLINIGRENKLRTLISKIADESKVSVHLHRKYGFRYIGVMEEVGEKFGRVLDVHLMQKILN